MLFLVKIVVARCLLQQSGSCPRSGSSQQAERNAPEVNGPRGHSVGVTFSFNHFLHTHKHKMKINHLTMTIVKVTV